METFCGTCGANRQADIEDRLTTIQTLLKHAEELRSQAEYAQAISQLRAAADETHPRLLAANQQVREMIQHFDVEFRERVGDEEKKVATAEELLKRQSYDEALQLLEQVPQPLRSARLETMLASARGAIDEIDELRLSIRSAVREKRILDLPPFIERMLALNHANESVRQLGGQVREQICRASARRLSEHRYDEALELLGRVPLFARDQQVESMVDNVGELACLMADMRESPYLNATLLTIGERLLKMAPNNGEALSLFAELQERVRDKPTDVRFPYVRRSSESKTSRLGRPFDCWAGLKHVTFANDQPAASTSSMTGWMVAVGLALQGVGLGVVNTDLRPTEKKGLFSRFSLRRNKWSEQGVWGIDVGGSSLKAVRMVLPENAKQPTITDTVYLPHNRSWDSLEANERWSPCRETLKEFFDLCGNSKTESLCVGLPGYVTLGRFFSLPPVETKRIKDLVQYQARAQIPFDFDEVTWDYHILPATSLSGQSTKPGSIVALLAAKRRLVQDLVRVFQELGSHVALVQCDCVALYNAAYREFFANSAEVATNEPFPMAIVDVGADATNVIVATPDDMWFRSFRLGGNSFTHALVREFQLTFAQAEQVKLQPTKARRIRSLYQTWEPLFQQFANELLRSIGAYETSHKDPVKKILFVGGGHWLHGLMRYLYLAE